MVKGKEKEEEDTYDDLFEDDEDEDIDRGYNLTKGLKENTSQYRDPYPIKSKGLTKDDSDTLEDITILEDKTTLAKAEKEIKALKAKTKDSDKDPFLFNSYQQNKESNDNSNNNIATVHSNSNSNSSSSFNHDDIESVDSIFFCFLSSPTSFDCHLSLKKEEGDLLLRLAQKGRVRDVKKLLLYWQKQYRRLILSHHHSSSRSSIDSPKKAFFDDEYNEDKDNEKKQDQPESFSLLDIQNYEEESIFLINNLLQYSDRHGWNLLHVSCNAGHDGIVSLILEAISNLAEIPLAVVSMKRKKRWKKKCIDLITYLLLQEDTLNGWTPLHVACMKGSIKCIRHILTFCYGELDEEEKNETAPPFEKNNIKKSNDNILLDKILSPKDFLLDSPLDILTNVSNEEKIMITNYWFQGKVYMNVKDAIKDHEICKEKKKKEKERLEEEIQNLRNKILTGTTTMTKEKENYHQKLYDLPTSFTNFAISSSSSSSSHTNNDNENDNYINKNPLLSSSVTSTYNNIHNSQQSIFIDPEKFSDKSIINTLYPYPHHHMIPNQENYDMYKKTKTTPKTATVYQTKTRLPKVKNSQIINVEKSIHQKETKNKPMSIKDSSEKSNLKAKMSAYVSPYSYSTLKKGSTTTTRKLNQTKKH